MSKEHKKIKKRKTRKEKIASQERLQRKKELFAIKIKKEQKEQQLEFLEQKLKQLKSKQKRFRRNSYMVLIFPYIITTALYSTNKFSAPETRTAKTLTKTSVSNEEIYSEEVGLLREDFDLPDSTISIQFPFEKNEDNIYQSSLYKIEPSKELEKFILENSTTIMNFDIEELIKKANVLDKSVIYKNEITEDNKAQVSAEIYSLSENEEKISLPISKEDKEFMNQLIFLGGFCLDTLVALALWHLRRILIEKQEKEINSEGELLSIKKAEAMEAKVNLINYRKTRMENKQRVLKKENS